MFNIDIWQEIFYTIRKNKLRTILTAMGVFWGILILMLLLGSGKGMQNGILSMFKGRAVNSVYFWTSNTTLTYNGLSAGRTISLNNQDVKLLKQNFIEEIKHLAPSVNLQVRQLSNGQQTGAFTVKGETPQYFEIETHHLQEGRLLNNIDIEKQRKVIVIGRELKEIFFPNVSAIGEYLSFDESTFQIVGVFQNKNGKSNGDRREQRAYIPFSTAQKLQPMPNQISMIACALHPELSASYVEKQMKSLLRRNHQIHPEDLKGIRSRNMEKEFKQFSGLFSAVDFFIWLVGIGTLFAGIVGVGNIMLIIVKERTREIGIRKAMGAGPGEIVTSILLESVFITTLSGYVGILTGIITINILDFVLTNFQLNSRYFANPEVDLPMSLTALGILIISGFLAGLIPALKASRVNPVIALRNE